MVLQRELLSDINATKLYFFCGAMRRFLSLEEIIGYDVFLLKFLRQFRWFRLVSVVPLGLLFLEFPYVVGPLVLVGATIRFVLPRLRRRVLSISASRYMNQPARTCLWLRPFIREGVEVKPSFTPETLIRLALIHRYALRALTDQQHLDALVGFEPVVTDDATWHDTFDAEIKRADIVIMIPEAVGATAEEIENILTIAGRLSKIFWVQLPDHVASAGRHRDDDADLYRFFWTDLREKFRARGIDVPAFRSNGQVFRLLKSRSYRRRLLGSNIDRAAFSLRSFIWFNTRHY